jgi:hypothetical protein
VPEWSPEHLVDEQLARRLIADQCFAPTTLRLLGEGWELPDAGLTFEARCALGRPLGRFLRKLHDAVVTAELPVDPMQRANMVTRAPRTLQALVEIDRSM